VQERQKRGVAGDAPRGLRADRRALLDGAAGRFALAGEGLRLGVDHDLMALCGRAWQRAAGERALGDLGQRVGPVDPGVLAHRCTRLRLRGTALGAHRSGDFALVNRLLARLDRLQEEGPVFG